MALAYTKEFLIDALCSRYSALLSPIANSEYRKVAEEHYDKVGKDKFRVDASLDADAIKKYKLELKAKV